MLYEFDIGKSIITFVCSDERIAMSLDAQRIGDFKSNKFWLPKTTFTLKSLLNLTKNKELEKALSDIETYNFMIENDFFFSEDDILREYQKIVSGRIMESGSFGVFMEQRTGKTPTSIISTNHFKKIVVCVPNGLQTNWCNEWEKFGNRVPIKLVNKTPAKRQKIYSELGDEWILVVSRETIAADAKKGLFKHGFDCLIVDEAHFLRNWKTNLSKGVAKLTDMSDYVLLMTGTPATNGSWDVIPLLTTINRKELKTKKRGLINYFFKTVNNGFAEEPVGIKESKLKEWLEFYNRHAVVIKKKDVLHWLPEVSREKIYLEQTPHEKKFFDEIHNFFRINTTEGKRRIENVPNKLNFGVFATLDTRVLDGEHSSAKTEWLINELDVIKKEPTIIWTSSKKYAELLSKILTEHDVNHRMINGDVSNSDRAMYVEEFQSGKVDLLVLTIKTMNAGYTMDRAETMIFMNRSYVMIDNAQADARFDSISQDKEITPKRIIDLHTKGTYDFIVEAINDKKFDKTFVVNNFNEVWNKQKEKK